MRVDIMLRPDLPHTGGSSVDPQENQGIFPLAVRFLHPDVGVPVTGAGHDPVSFRGPVDPGHPEVVLVEDSGLGPSPSAPGGGVERDVLGVVGEGQL